MRITWQPVGRRGPMASEVQGVEGGNSVILAGLNYSFCFVEGANRGWKDLLLLLGGSLLSPSRV